MKEITVLFADVSGWTDLCARVGDTAAKRIVDPMFQQLRNIVERREGQVVKRIGDELMCVFQTPAAAAEAAFQMQRCADDRNHSAAEKLFLRIGFHAGPVLREHNDIFGDTVNIAARVVAEAFRERILTTRETAASFPTDIAATVSPWRSAALKGKDAKVDLMELIWREGGSTLVRQKTTTIMKADHERLRVGFLAHQCVLTRGGGAIKFGRGPTNDLVIDDPSSYVSSSHGHIEFRGGVIEIVDTSRNGI
ncbi:MAG TPA: adenylate/guanylate cyclase domain-containing protein, partial [Terriglobales bacterium]|nr:adenylate/guanylate cyclase domain-containing protein [Terriglobales bacterium]